MRYTKISLAFFSLTAILVAVACASTEDVAPAEPTEEQEQQKPAPLPTSTGTTAPQAPEKKCVPKCTQDSECASSCPAKTNAVNCCDVTTGTCYANASGTCPKNEDSGTPPPAY